MRLIVGLLMVLVSVIAVGCAGPSAARPSYVEVSAASIGLDDQIPPPTGDVILTVTGALTKANMDGGVAFDMATLEQLGLVRYTVQDPWLDERIEFTGVLLSSLAEAVGVRPEATILHFVALDDYAVDISIADIERWPVLLATQSNGSHMPVDEMGPTRVVFPYDQFPEINHLAYKDLWIWQVSAIEVR